MEISYDPAKREATLVLRGLDFDDAVEVFAGPVLTNEDTRVDYPEPRFVTFGLLNERMVTLVWTGAAESPRIISMRKANEREQARYRNRLA